MNDSVQSTRGGSCTVTVQNTRCLPESEPGLYFIPDPLVLETATSGNDTDDDFLAFIPLGGSGGGDGSPPDVGGGGIPVDPISETLPGGFFDFEVGACDSFTDQSEVTFQELVAPFDTLAIHLIAEGLVLDTALAGDASGDVAFQEINNTGSFGSVTTGTEGGSPRVLTEF